MFDPRGFDNAITWLDPADRQHPINMGRVLWLLARPEGMGGPSWRDVIGRNSATLTNFSIPATTTSGWQPTTRPGGYGHLLFNGSTNQVDITAGAIPSGAAARSWSCWFKTSTSGLKVLFDTGNTVASGNRFLVYDSGTGSLLIEFTGFATITGTTSIIDGAWHQTVATYDGTNAALYLDGKSEGSPGARVLTTQSGIRFGRALDNGGPFPGPMDSFSCWNRALSPANVLALYQEERAGCPTTLNRIGSSALMATKAPGGPWPWFGDEISGGLKTMGIY